MEERWRIESRGNGDFVATKEPEFSGEGCLISIVGVFALAVIVLVGSAFHSTKRDVRARIEQARIDAVRAVSASVCELEIDDYRSSYVYEEAAYEDASGKQYTGPSIEFYNYYALGGANAAYAIVDVSKFDYSRFTGTILAGTWNNNDQPIIFRVYADDRCIYDNGGMDSSAGARSIDLSIPDADEIKFVAFLDEYWISSNESFFLVDPMFYGS